MKTPEQILKEKCPGIILFGVGTGTDRKLNAVLEAMEEYAIQKLEQTVASYEIDRINLVAMTLERDELDEQYKNAVADRDAYRDMYKETIQERDGWISEYKEKVTELNGYLENRQDKVEHLKLDVLEYKTLYEEYKQRYEHYKAEFDFAAKACATQTEKLELAQQVIKSIHERETYSEVQTIAKNYLSDQSPEFICQPDEHEPGRDMSGPPYSKVDFD